MDENIGPFLPTVGTSNCGSSFIYKKYNRIVLMALVDADYKFLIVEVGAYGRESDGVFSRCRLSTAFTEITLSVPPPKPFPQEGDAMSYVIVADDAFPLKTYLMNVVQNIQLFSQFVFEITTYDHAHLHIYEY